jgi:hypothetical protein
MLILQASIELFNAQHESSACECNQINDHCPSSSRLAGAGSCEQADD